MIKKDMKKIHFSHKKIYHLRNKILKAREKKYYKIIEFSRQTKNIKKNYFTTIVIHLNIKGFPKNNMNFIEALKYFIKFLEPYFIPNKILKYDLLFNIDGDCLLINIDEDPMIVKYFFYNFEKNWRFFDIDIYTKKSMISSSLLGLDGKRCVICKRKYDFCKVNNKHTTRQVRKKVNFLIKKFNSNFK